MSELQQGSAPKLRTKVLHSVGSMSDGAQLQLVDGGWSLYRVDEGGHARHLNTIGRPNIPPGESRPTPPSSYAAADHAPATILGLSGS